MAEPCAGRQYAEFIIMTAIELETGPHRLKFLPTLKSYDNVCMKRIMVLYHDIVFDTANSATVRAKKVFLAPKEMRSIIPRSLTSGEAVV